MSHPIRIAVLWQHVTGYVQAALDGLLAADARVTLLVVQAIEQRNDPFQVASHARQQVIQITQEIDWLEQVVAFQPVLAVISASGGSAYREAARRLHVQSCIIVWADDRVHIDRLRDTYQALLGRVFKRWRHFDAAFVPGVQAAAYAASVGFDEQRIFHGLYSCDVGLFRPIGQQRHQQAAEWPRRFFYLGQFIERKGIDSLLAAYRRYRQTCESEPWELWCAGRGELESLLQDESGVRVLGFLNSAECATVMSQVGAFVLPSRWDHWGVVLHEAASAGLPIIASDRCFGTRDLVRHNQNGIIFTAGDAEQLTDALHHFSDAHTASEAGRHSLRMAAQFSPSHFANTLLHDIPRLLKGNSLCVSS